MTKVFISYSRKDKAFAGRFTEALQKSELETWIDWEDIPPTADWLDQIHKGIQQADGFLFLLSPDSVASKVCGQEVDHAVLNGKRLIPIVVRDVNPNDVHPALAKVNWIDARDGDDFDGAVAKTLSAIRTDLTWVESHRRLQVRALEWDKRKDRSLLLRGKDLREAEEQLASAGQKDPQPTDLQRRFILESRRGESRTRNLLLSISAGVMISLALLSVFAINQRNIANDNALTAEANQHTAETARADAEQKTRIARAGELAAQSVVMRERQPIVSYLLGLEAFKLLDNMRIRSVLVENLQTRPDLMQYLIGNNDPIYNLDFSPDGKTLAAASGNEIILWDIDTRKIVTQLAPIDFIEKGSWGAIYSIAFSPDGKLLASGNLERIILIWDLSSKKPIIQLDTKEVARESLGQVFSVDFSPDGKTLASGVDNGTVILWDLTAPKPFGEPYRAASRRNTAIMSVVFSPDGKTLAYGNLGGSVFLLDTTTLTPVFRPIEMVYAMSLAFSPDGKTLATVWSKNIILWDVSTQTRIGELMGHEGIIRCITFSPDGKLLASSSEDNTVILWDVATQKAIYKPFSGHTEKVMSVAFSPDGKTLASGSADATIILWSLDHQLLLNQKFTLPTDTNDIAFGPDGKTFAYLNDDGSLVLQEELQKTIIDEKLFPQTDWTNMTFSPDGKTLAYTINNSIILWDMSTHQRVGQPLIGHTDLVNTIAFSLDGKILASGSNTTIVLWNVSTHQPIGQPINQSADILHFGPDGTIFASSRGNKITMWDMYNRTSPIDNIPDPNFIIAVSPDGKILATGGCAQVDINNRSICTQGEIGLWDISNRTRIGSLTAHKSGITNMVFSSDGNILASSSENDTILWDVSTRQPIGLPLVGRIMGYDPNGEILASKSGDTILFWDISSHSWVKKTCQLIGRNFTRTEWTQFFPNEKYRKTCDEWSLESETIDTPTP